MRRHIWLIPIAIWFLGGMFSLWLGFPVCFTPGHEVGGFIIPMKEIKEAFSGLGLPSDWIPATQHIIRKETLNGVDALINAFAYYEVFFLGLILMLPKISPFVKDMFSGGWWSILSGAVEVVFIFTIGLASAIAVLGFQLLSQTSSIDYKIVFFLATLPALVVVIAVALVIWGMFSGGTPVSSGGGAGGNGTYGKAPANSTDNHGDVALGMRKAGTFYEGSSWLTEELAGRVDEEGNIYRGSNWITEEKVGRIDQDGNIYKGSNWLTEEKVGRIDEDGNIHRGSNWFTEEKAGRIDEEGNVYKGSNLLTEEKIGRVEEKDK